MHAYAQATLDEVTFKLTRISSGDKLFDLIRGDFLALKVLQNFYISTRNLPLFFKDLIRQGSALAYIDDILLMLNFKPNLLQPIQLFEVFANKKIFN